MKKGNHFGSSDNFITLTNSIRNGLPRTYFYGILMSYLINAIMIGFFIFPALDKMVGYWPALIVSAFGTVVIQMFRGQIVFTDLLFAESGETSKLQVKIVALVMTLVGIFELWHLLSGFTATLTPGEIVGVFVFGSSIIVGGWMMEINFIKQTNEFIYQQQQFPLVGTIGGQNVHAESALLRNLLAQVTESQAPTPSAASSQQKSGTNQELLKQEAVKRQANLHGSNSQQKSGTGAPSLKERSTQEMNDLLEAQEEFEERSLSQRPLTVDFLNGSPVM